MSRARRLGSVSFHIARYVSTIVVTSAMSNLLGVVGCICRPLSSRSSCPAITREVMPGHGPVALARNQIVRAWDQGLIAASKRAITLGPPGTLGLLALS